MNAGLSIHAVDIANGCPAAGMKVEILHNTPGPVIQTATELVLDANGKAVLENAPAGLYRVIFHAADYFELSHRSADDFLEKIAFSFGLADPDRHHHLPLKFTLYGYSLFVTR